MGVPAFFRWLTLRCPMILQDAVEQSNEQDFIDQFGENEITNPDIDNLYLDMNGIIHPCTHPEKGELALPLCENDMFNNIFAYIDNIMKIIKPKKQLIMAIDGVAPRAKMNQQRSRRFRSALEMQQSAKIKQTLKDKYIQQKANTKLIDKLVDDKFDYCVITPGTEFMDRLSQALQKYVYVRQNENPLWKHLIVVYSDANLPGEGEHKIMEYIRLQRAQPDYDPNTKHCLYGADADLIMLGLSSHDPHFYIFRETIMGNQEKKCTKCGQTGHFFNECRGLQRQKQGEFDEKAKKEVMVNFQFINLAVCREYIDYEMSQSNIPFEYDLERVIDDFVFQCFLVGNDFLPNLPGFEIRQAGIDSLFHVYKRMLPEMGGYITNNGDVDLKRLNKYFKELGLIEEVLIKNIERQEEFQKKNTREQDPNLKAAEELKRSLQEECEKNEEFYLKEFNRDLKQIQDDQRNKAQADHVVNEEQLKKTTIQMNYKQKYYMQKFGIQPKEFLEFKQKIKKSYVEGICWNFAYYYKGCISWGWFFNYHYAPFVSDLENIDEIEINFDKGKPFRPMDQLMAVLSPLSAAAIPECFQHLMTDEDSNIIDFYPKEFVTDVKGKRFAWMGEVLLPFIEEDRLLKELEKHYHKLTVEELKRNKLKKHQVFISKQNQQFENFIINTQNRQDYLLKHSQNNLTGTLKFNRKSVNLGIKLETLGGLKLETVVRNQVQNFKFDFPEYVQHISMLKQGVQLPPRKILPAIMDQVDKKAFSGAYMIRQLDKLLGSSEDIGSKLSYGKNTNDELINQNQFNRNFKHNHFTDSYNNNRSVYRDPVMYKTPETIQKMQEQGKFLNSHHIQSNKSQKYQDKQNKNQERQSFQQNYYIPPNNFQNQQNQNQYNSSRQNGDQWNKNNHYGSKNTQDQRIQNNHNFNPFTLFNPQQYQSSQNVQQIIQMPGQNINTMYPQQKQPQSAPYNSLTGLFSQYIPTGLPQQNQQQQDPSNPYKKRHY